MKGPVTTLILLILVLAISSGSGLEQECYLSTDGEEVCSEKNDAATGEGNASGTYMDDHGAIEDEDNTPFEDENEEEQEDPNCKDTHELCVFWASIGECDNNPNYMLNGCPRSCNTCPDNKVINGLNFAQRKEKQIVLKAVEEYGLPQEVSDTNHGAEALFYVRQTVDYMKNHVHSEVRTHQLVETVINTCRNNDKLCSFWAAIGECENNPSFMVTKCAPACRSCHMIDFDTRCGNRDPNAVPGLMNGELNLMFERIVENAPGNVSDDTQLAAKERKIQDNGTPLYTVTVHSRPETPSPKPDGNNVIALDKTRDVKEAPWVVTLDNFLSDEECDYMIQLGYKFGYKRSKDVGARLEDGSYGSNESQSRTSENAWCASKDGCREDPVVSRVMSRLSNVTGIPIENYEDFQLLKYEIGQFYRVHHDYIAHQADRLNGPRILTFFLYLSDVEEGGGTNLNDLGIEIKPKKGRALLWPSVMNYDPLVKDRRTRHEALSVIKGTKFAANAWIHLFNNVEAQTWGCN